MNTVDKVIKIAEAEVGYLEKKTNKDLDSKTKNAGYNNYTKYGRDMHKIYPSVMDFPAPWCDCFVDWCFHKAYGVATAKSLLGGNFNDYTVASADMYKKKNAWHTKNPKVGDQIFFKNDSRICHTGLVYKVDSSKVYTIEGNTSTSPDVVSNGGGVCKKSYSLTHPRIAGYGRPKYDVAKTTTTKTPEKVSNKSNNTSKVGSTTKVSNINVETAKSFSKTLASSYKVATKTDPLCLRVGAGSDKKVITKIPKGAIVKCYGYYTSVNNTKWLLVTYKNYTGYVSKVYLTRA